MRQPGLADFCPDIGFLFQNRPVDEQHLFVLKRQSFDLVGDDDDLVSLVLWLGLQFLNELADPCNRWKVDDQNVKEFSDAAHKDRLEGKSGDQE